MKASACAYAILGGVNRYIAQKNSDVDSDHDNRIIGASGSKLRIHQFYQNAALDEPTRKAFSAIDKSSDQMLMAILLEYALRMGADVRLVQAASIIPPWQDLRWLTQAEIIAWKLDNTHRVYTNLTFHSFGRSGAYVEASSTKGVEVSSLRMFCKSGIKEPLFTFITNHTITKSNSGTGPNSISIAKDRVTDVLSRMNIALAMGPTEWQGRFQIQDIHGVALENDKVRVYVAVRPIGFNRQNADRLTRVALQDNGDLSRADWTFQDFVKFNIKGDRRLISIAMRNCVE